MDFLGTRASRLQELSAPLCETIDSVRWPCFKPCWMELLVTSSFLLLVAMPGAPSSLFDGMRRSLKQVSSKVKEVEACALAVEEAGVSTTEG